MRSVQLALASLGYSLRGSGNFGAATVTAVKAFQEAHGLEIDGEIGAETAKAIDLALTELRTAASPIADLVGNRILRIGDAGPIVQTLQLDLRRLGYPLNGTGNFDPATDQAVRDFQTRHALEVDGEVGPEMAKAVDWALAAVNDPAKPSVSKPGDATVLTRETPPPKPQPTQLAGPLTDLIGSSVLALGDQGSAVQAVQLALAKLGYGLKGSGYFGGATETAIADFQQQRGLEVDGEVGVDTVRAIDLALAAAQPPARRPQGEQPPAADMRPLWVIEGLKWLNLAENSR